MWFIADLFERYTTSVAKTFVKLAVMEAEANQRALASLRARHRRRDLILPDRTLHVEPSIVHPHSGAALTSHDAPEHAIHTVEGELDAEVAGAREAAGMMETIARSADPAAMHHAMPMGVRGDVVVRWLTLFAEAERRDMAGLLEKLRKDKKVRVAELQMICAEALGESPQTRKKAEHLAVLKAHFLPAERRAATASETRPGVN